MLKHKKKMNKNTYKCKPIDLDRGQYEFNYFLSKCSFKKNGNAKIKFSFMDNFDFVL